MAGPRQRGDGPWSVAVAGFNAGADPDLAVTNVNSSNVSVLLNTALSAIEAEPSGV